MWFFSPRKNRRPISTRRPRPGYRPRLESLEDRCVPSAPGTLDSSFGSGGIVTTTFGKKPNDYANGVAVQSDGKIVEAGVSYDSSPTAYYLDVARYNANGTLDNSFGSGGKVQTAVAHPSSAGGLVLQSDGKIVVGNTANGAFELIRYNSNGTLDKTFNGTGMVTTAFSPNGAELHGLALESVNGITKIVAAGWNSFNDGNFGFALARYNLDGSLDSSFGSGGKVLTDLGYDTNFGGIAIQGDGQILVGATNNPANRWIVARYGIGGSLDLTFGNGGVVTSTFQGVGGNVAVQPDGKIVESGRDSALHWAIERLNSDGSLDPSFGTGGIVVGPVAQGLGRVAVQTNGKLVAAGGAPVGVSGFELTRFNPDGSLDTSFGTNGQVNTSINGNGALADLAFQADGKIIAAGSAPQVAGSAPFEFSLVRYWGDPVPVIGSFSATPNPVKSGSSLTLTASNITDANPGATITQVAFYLAPSTGNYQLNSNATLLGYATQTSPGVWTFTFTVNLAPGSYTIFAQAEDSLGIFSYADALTLTVQ